MAESRKPHIILAAGGTGGHVYPAIAIADALKAQQPDLRISFIGTSTHMEWQAVPKAGYPIESIWISGFHRRFTLKNLLFPLKVLVSLVQSWRIFRRIKPVAVVCTGGYVSAPVGWQAHHQGVQLYVQEQNSFPGVANRLISKYAKRLYIAFDEAKNWFKHVDIRNYGNPVRKALVSMQRDEAVAHFGLDPNRPTILVVGGSLGAKSLNEAMKEHLAELHDRLQLQIIWQTGKLYYENLRSDINTKSFPNLRMMPYIDHMPAAYGVADVVISRAGASSLSEIQNLGKVAILVPSPNVAGNHQYHNAHAMQSANASVLLEDSLLNKELVIRLKQVLEQPTRMIAMQKNAQAMAKTQAAAKIAQEILQDLNLTHINKAS